MYKITSCVVPLLILVILGYAAAKRAPVFESFVKGAKSGAKTAAALLPTLVFLLTAVAAFKSSGAVDVVSSALAPVFGALGIPKELAPVALLRPVSGSGSIALYNELLKSCGADSSIARMASVALASTETTFYTIAIYFGSCKIKKSGATLPAAMSADLCGFVLGCALVRLFF